MERRTQMVLGIDEAGRGPVIGPLVLCGVWLPRVKQRLLLEIGVRDSKAFGSNGQARRRRAQLAAQIRQLAAHVTVLTVDSSEVDRRVRLGELNMLEQELAVAVVESHPLPRRIVADGEKIFRPLRPRFEQLFAMDRADESCPAVAAASIVAKAERDRQFARIAALYEADFGKLGGGGYVNKQTEAFIRAHFERFGCLPAEVRRSWSWSVLLELRRREAGLAPACSGEQLSLLP